MFISQIAKVFAVLLASLLLLAPIAAADELTFKNVQLEEDEVAPGDMLEITFDLENTAGKDYKDVEATAQIKGEDDKATISIGTISAGGKREEKKISVGVPDDLKDGTHSVVLKAKGKLVGVGTKSFEKEISFKVEQKDYSAYVKEVELSEDGLLAGTPVDVAIKIANNGKNDLEGLKVQVEIPELKAKQAVKLLSVLGQENEQTVYMTLNVPESAESGIYTLKTSILNSRVEDVEVQNVEVTKVLPVKVAEVSNRIIPAQVSTPSITLGQQGAVVSLAIANNQDSKKTFDLVLGGVMDWTSSARVDPARLTLEAGQSQTAQVYLLPKASGDKSFTLYVKDGSSLVSATQVNVKVAAGVAGKELPQVSASWLFAVLVLIAVLAAGFVYKRGNGQKKLGHVYY